MKLSGKKRRGWCVSVQVMCGFVLNVLSVPFLLLATVTWGNAFFHFDVLPPEFLQNATTIANSPAV